MKKNTDKFLKEAIEVDEVVGRMGSAMLDTMLKFDLRRFTLPMDVRCLASAKLTLGLVFQKAANEGKSPEEVLNWIQAYMDAALVEYEDALSEKEKRN